VLKWPNLQLPTRLVLLGEVSLLDRGFHHLTIIFYQSALATLILRTAESSLEGLANVLQNIVDIVGLGTLSRTNHIDKRVHLYEVFFLEARAGRPSLFVKSVQYLLSPRMSGALLLSLTARTGWRAGRFSGTFVAAGLHGRPQCF